MDHREEVLQQHLMINIVNVVLDMEYYQFKLLRTSSSSNPINGDDSYYAMYFVNVGTNEYLKTTNLYNGGDSDDGDGSNTEFLLANFNVNHDCTTKLQIGYVGANDGWMYWLNDVKFSKLSSSSM